MLWNACCACAAERLFRLLTSPCSAPSPRTASRYAATAAWFGVRATEAYATSLRVRVRNTLFGS
jgi:hypothetical protein